MYFCAGFVKTFCDVCCLSRPVIESELVVTFVLVAWPWGPDIVVVVVVVVVIVVNLLFTIIGFTIAAGRPWLAVPADGTVVVEEGKFTVDGVVNADGLLRGDSNLDEDENITGDGAFDIDDLVFSISMFDEEVKSLSVFVNDVVFVEVVVCSVFSICLIDVMIEAVWVEIVRGISGMKEGEEGKDEGEVDGTCWSIEFREVVLDTIWSSFVVVLVEFDAVNGDDA